VKIKANGNLYAFPQKPISLGEARIVKKEYGVVFGRDEFDLFDPDWAAAFLYRAMREADPNLTSKLAIQAVNEITEIDFVADDGSELTGDEEETEAPPTEAAAETPPGN
jgi:hypothetical protein